MKSLNQWRNNHLLLSDMLLSISVFIILVVFAETHPSIIAASLNKNRSILYGALTAVFAALLGFIITAASIIIGYSKDAALFYLRNSKHYTTLWDIFISTTKWLAYSTVASFIGLLVDKDDSPKIFITFGVALIALITSSRVWRCILVFEKILIRVARYQD